VNSTLANVRQLAGTITGQADDVEHARRVSLGLVAELATAGCFRMFVPRRHGGDELTLVEGLDIIEEVSAADGSTGWVVMIGANTPIIFGFAPPATFDKVYAGGPDVISGGAVAPKGTATRTDGGYLATGQWPFASGCQHAHWLGVNCVVTEEGAPAVDPQGRAQLRMLMFPPAHVEIVDTWKVVGLRGTGSHDLRLHDAFCPDGFSFRIDGPSRRSEPIFRIPVIPHLGLWVSAVAVGIARGALADIVALAGRGKQPAFGRKLAESTLFHDKIGQAEVTLRGARALLHDQARAAWHRAAGSEEFTPAERAGIRAAAAHVATVAAEVVDVAYAAGGGNSVYESSPLQRRLRDVHAVTQHVSVSTDAYSTLGAVLSGQSVNPLRL
jgi:alkylation response protein AidB-like acyl-CoA dehydrogenase